MNSKGMKLVMSKDTENKVQENNEELITEENKYNTVSLKEIREALANKVNNEQKKNIVKEFLINVCIAIVMIVYLIIVMMGSKNISVDVLEKDIKIITLFILAIGIFILELSYKKDDVQLAMHGVEVLVFGSSNLCLIYVIKLYFNNLSNTITYIGIVVTIFYILKSLLLTVRDVKRYKNENNDIREIVKKK